MNEFRETFRRIVEEEMAMHGLQPLWEKGMDRDAVVIPKQGKEGFEVQLECFDYGIYPYAEGWHGGPWDVTVWKPSELECSLREFIRSALTDAVLVVHESNGKQYKWILEYQFEGERVSDEVGLLFFNWFGNRTVKRYCNNV